MINTSLYEKLCTYAALDSSDVVLDAGAGFGFLSSFLADKCKAVIAVEKDPQVANALREQVKDAGNVNVIMGDVLKEALPKFNKIVAIPPYYLSSQLITWLVEGRIDCAVMILQKEFATRLTAAIGSEDYSWLTVLTCRSAEVEILDAVPKEMFYPQPKVDSVIIRIKPRVKGLFEIKDAMFFKRMVKWLFTQRNKKVGKALTPFTKSSLRISKQEAERIVLSLPFHDRRARELSPEDFGVLANAICN